MPYEQDHRNRCRVKGHRRISSASRKRSTPAIASNDASETDNAPIRRLRFPRPGNTDRRLRCLEYRRRALASDLWPHERRQAECGPVILSAPDAHPRPAAQRRHRPERSTALWTACEDLTLIGILGVGRLRFP